MLVDQRLDALEKNRLHLLHVPDDVLCGGVMVAWWLIKVAMGNGDG